MPRVTLLRASTLPAPPFADPTSNSGARSAMRRDEIQSCDPLLRPSAASPPPSTGSPPGTPIEQFPEITFRSQRVPGSCAGCTRRRTLYRPGRSCFQALAVLCRGPRAIHEAIIG